MSHLQRPKGTQDIVGDELPQWQRVEALFRQAMQRANYQEIRTPIFESTDLFKRGVGESTDIVNKEMYTFEKGERSLTLRPEGTAGVVRAYIEQGMSRWPKPVKLYYLGPMFRYERPQAGRQRQFHQMGLELFGLDTPESDAEVILLAMRFFESLGLPNLALEMNNIGTPADREQFKTNFKQLIQPTLTQLCEDCQTRFETNPLRMLDCKVTGCQQIYDQPEIQAFLEQDFTGSESQAHFGKLAEILTACNIPFKRNFRLVRGLDYYTKTVFEITSTNLGAQNAVCGGGRYNHLVETLGGPPTPGIGWALGVERLVTLLGACQKATPEYYIVTDQPADAFQLAEKLRANGSSVEVNLSDKGIGKQLEQAFKSGAKKVLILGESEVQHKTITIKDLDSREQQTVPQEDLLKPTTALVSQN